MPGVISHTTIPKNVSTANDLDFYHLLSQGIAYLEEYGGRIWTDFNTHDPGRTMLEMLCYAITDLGMRIDMPISDLLANEHTNLQAQFYKASEVLPSKPVTELDYRKIFVDIKGVKNCWLKKHDKTVYVDCKNNKLSYNQHDFLALDKTFKRKFQLNGLYDLLVDFDLEDRRFTQEDIDGGKNTVANISEAIRLKYHAHRNLCEDLISIEEVKTKSIAVCAQIEVHPEVDEEWVHAQVLHAIEDYFSPQLQFQTLAGLLDKGLTTDEIFDGPLLEGGFIEKEALRNTTLRKEVRLSDIMKIVMGIDGVKLIKDISIGYCDSNIPLPNEWVICIEDYRKPVLCKASAFSYSKGVLPLNINEKQVDKYREQLKEDEANNRKKVAEASQDLQVSQGSFVEPDAYTTIQNDFPDVYGIGQEGLSARATRTRKAQAKQLKGYLIFFDQILASYFKHLGKVKDLLAINKTETKTYFTQAIEDIKGFDELVKNYEQHDDDALTKTIFEQFDNNIDRRNEILDHLLGRFAERFGEYAFLMKTLYGSATDEIVLANKEAFLKDYVAISAERGCAFNYFKQPFSNLWNTNNVAGWQKRITRLLGMKNYSRRTLSSSFIEIYEQDSNGTTVYRWRIKNEQGDIVLSATTSYASRSLASREMYLAVLLLIQCNEKKLQLATEPGSGELLLNTVRIHKGNSGKYSFDVVNPEVTDHNSADWIVAKQYKYHNSFQEVKDAVAAAVQFLKYEFTEEGMFVVEHILLRPEVSKTIVPFDNFIAICADNCDDCEPLDPYSYRLSIVLPGYTYRFSNPDFRAFMEARIKEELPAHILPKICWVGHRKDEIADDENDLFCFEEAYQDFLRQNTKPLPVRDEVAHETALKSLLEALSKLNTIYPTGRLLDCKDESDELEGRIILGQTNLGTL